MGCGSGHACGGWPVNIKDNVPACCSLIQVMRPLRVPNAGFDRSGTGKISIGTSICTSVPGISSMRGGGGSLWVAHSVTMVSRKNVTNTAV